MIRFAAMYKKSPRNTSRGYISKILIEYNALDQFYIFHQYKVFLERGCISKILIRTQCTWSGLHIPKIKSVFRQFYFSMLQGGTLVKKDTFCSDILKVLLETLQEEVFLKL